MPDALKEKAAKEKRCNGRSNEMNKMILIAVVLLLSANFASAQQPKTVLDFMKLLPEKYFNYEGCDKATDRDCSRAQTQYIETYLEINDTANGYLKAGCDGAQSCIEMTLFRKPDSTYIVAIRTLQEIFDENRFLTYRNGRWTDVSKSVIPQFSTRNEYELPRYGTTIKVYRKKIIEKGPDYEVTERGPKLYDLVWRDGRFTIKR